MAQRPVVPRLDTVRVVARTTPAAEATRTLEVITRDDLARRAGRSLAELLAQSPGLDAQVRSPAQSDLSIRGSSFNQVVVLVDGIRVSDVQSGHYALDLVVPAAMIERIEILRGGASSLYGSDAAGGIINIVTRSDRPAGSAALRGGSWGGVGGGVSTSAGSDARQVRVAADADRSDGHRPGTDYRVVQARASAEQRTRVGRVVADVAQGVRRFGAADFYSPYPSDETTRTTTAAVRVVPEDAARVTVGGTAHLRRHTDLFTLKRDDPAFYQNQHTSRESGADIVARAALTERISVAGGIDVLDARLRSARLGDHAQVRQGTFAQATIGAASALVLDLGLRRDHLSDEGLFVSPSVGVSVPVRATRLRASLNRGFRAPTWTERFYRDPANIADSTLAVETFVAREVGLRAPLGAHVAADVALYERRAEDLIDWAKPAGAPPGTPWRTMNFTTARYRGAEASLNAPALLGADWTLRAAGLRFDASAAPGLVGKYALRPLTRTIALASAMHLSHDGTLTVDARHARRAGETGFLHVNARLNAPVGGTVASLELINLTGANYLDGAGKSVAGRSAFVGLAWSIP